MKRKKTNHHQWSIPETWENIFRAIQIAKLGGHSISIYYPSDYIAGNDNYKSIKNECSGWFDNFTANGEITLELLMPYSYIKPNSKIKYVYGLDEIIDKTNKAQNNPKPELQLCEVCESLLKIATEKLNLSYSNVQNCINVAATIAQLDGSDKIKVEHIVEAVHYSSPVIDNGYINAESNIITFGNNSIRINKHDIDAVAINEAIKYLNSLIV